MNIWLDDVRTAPDGWIHMHNIDELEKVIQIMVQKEDLFIDEMSFDYNLAHPKNGFDVMKDLAELCKKYNTKRFWPKIVLYHSNDVNGIKIMKEFTEEFEKELQKGLNIFKGVFKKS